MKTIEHDDALSRACFVDASGNVFSIPTTTDLEAAIINDVFPEGMELVFAGGAVNPKYAHILTAALLMYQMMEQSKVIFEAHSEQLQQVGTTGTMALGVAFENMAASLQVGQRNAIEGVSAIIAQSKKD